jgi:hypothetical protein
VCQISTSSAKPFRKYLAVSILFSDLYVISDNEKPLALILCSDAIRIMWNLMENIETVQRQMENEPQLSIRQPSLQTELSVSTYQ